jgi:hypothetical protein
MKPVGGEVTSRLAPPPDAVFIRVYPTKTDHTAYDYHPPKAISDHPVGRVPSRGVPAPILQSIDPSIQCVHRTFYEHHPQRQNRTLHKTIQEQVIQWLGEYRHPHSCSNGNIALVAAAADDKFCQKFYFPVFGFAAMM